MTILEWRTSGGECRRCDARCHGAALPACDCICGGRYHGKAGAELERLVAEDGEVLAARLRAEGLDVVVNREALAAARQTRLPGIPSPFEPPA